MKEEKKNTSMTVDEIRKWREEWERWRKVILDAMKRGELSKEMKIRMR